MMIFPTKSIWLLLTAAAGAVNGISVPGFLSSALSVRAAAVAAGAPHSQHLSPRHPRPAKPYTSSFLGGALIDIAQPPSSEPASGPAIYSVAATWNVPAVAPNAGADLTNPDNRHLVSHWVGITGGQCEGHEGGALFQAGTASTVSSPLFLRNREK